MKKIVTLCILFCTVIIMTSCGINEPQNTATKGNDTLNMIHKAAAIETYIPIPSGYRYDSMDERDFKIRAVVEAHEMDTFITGGNSNDKEDDVSKYGISDYWRNGNWINFKNPKNMMTVFSNQDFRKDFYKIYDIKFDIDGIYVTPNLYADTYSSNLVVLDKNYYLGMQGCRLNDRTMWMVFQSSQDIDLKVTAQLYAKLDGLDLKEAQTSDGNTVFYMTSSKKCILFTAIGLIPNSPTTAYLWKQDNALGVLVNVGEFSEDNLELCKLEKHAL